MLASAFAPVHKGMFKDGTSSCHVVAQTRLFLDWPHVYMDPKCSSLKRTWELRGMWRVLGLSWQIHCQHCLQRTVPVTG